MRLCLYLFMAIGSLGFAQNQHIYQQSDAPPEDKIERAIKTQNLVREFLEPYRDSLKTQFEVPDLKLLVLPRAKEPFCKWDDTLVFGLKANTFPKATFLHEFSHVIFNENLAKKMPAFTSLKNDLAALDKAEDFGDLREITVAKHKRLLDLLKCYEELFADTVAAVLLNDAQAISKDLFAMHDTWAANSRDFSKVLSARETKLQPPGWISSPYDALNPFRRETWTLYQSQKSKEGFNSVVFVRAVYDSMEQDILERWVDPGLYKIPSKQISDRLIQKLNSKLVANLP
jgi:hypothetical protein